MAIKIIIMAFSFLHSLVHPTPFRVPAVPDNKLHVIIIVGTNKLLIEENLVPVLSEYLRKYFIQFVFHLYRGGSRGGKELC